MASKRYVTQSLVGGLDTKIPQTRLDPSKSPDLENVLMNRWAIEKRPGLAPLIKEQPNLNAVQNVGHHGVSREGALSGAPNTDYLIVPGHMLAGHREIYENLGAVTIQFVCEVGDLTSTHGGNSEPTGPTRWGPAPFTIQVRPILSKGPIHRTDDVGTSHSPAQIPPTAVTWDTTNPWGDGATEGLPFCIYLWNNAGTWEWKLAFHTKATNWALQTVTNTTPVEVGAQYHIIATIDQATNTARLRVGRRRPSEATTYTDASTTFAGETWTTGNRCPLQVFDCPQNFIEGTTLGTPTLRPGLDLIADVEGGYFFSTKRFEGKIEDIVVYDSDKLSAATTALDREGKIDLALESGVINAWTMTEPGDQLVQEMTRRGNHLYFVPAGPVFDGVSGAVKGKGTWWFNGQTSYAMVDLEEGLAAPFNPNWRKYTRNAAQINAYMQAVVQNNRQHGIQVAFWPDSVEPEMEQVIMEIHGALRLSIGRDGRIRGYCRDSFVSAVWPLGGSMYEDQAVVSNFKVQPGRRYVAELMRLDGGGSLTLSINNGADITQTTGITASDSSANAASVGGITFGMGSVENTVQDPARAGTPNQLNVDSRAGFVGRIESARIVCANVRQAPIHKDTVPEDLEFKQAQLWANPSVNRARLAPEDSHDVVQNQIPGAALQVFQDTQNDRVIRHVAATNTNPNHFALFDNTPEVNEGAHGALLRAKSRIWFALSEWNFNIDDRLVNYAGSYLRDIEYRYNASDALEANAYRSVHVQASSVVDELGALGPIFKRCIESDVMSEDYFSAGATGPGERVTSHRLRPYQFRSPRELSTSWCRGMLTPLTETNRITLLADWQHQESGERFLMTAAGRQLYWAKPIWRKSSPFPGERETEVLWFGGQDGDRVEALATKTEQETTGAGSRTTVVFDAWLYPFALDGARMVAFKGDPFTERVNHSIYLIDGSVALIGTADANTKAWFFVEAGYSAANQVRSSAIKVGTWNHLHVTLKGTGPEVRVNGEIIPLADGSVDPTPTISDAFTLGTADAANYKLYLGGLPKGRDSMTFNATAGAIPAGWSSFNGLMTEVRVRNAEDLVNWPAGMSGNVPTARYADDANTYYLFHFNEGTGWGFVNAAVLASLDGAKAEINELVLVEEGLAESRDDRYDSVIFRDRLYITNAVDLPRDIRFKSFTDPVNPFRSQRLGMAQPFVHNVTLSEATSPIDGPIANGIYVVRMAFRNEDGTESEAALLGTIDLQGTAANGEGLHLTNLPRSFDPQTVARTFYCSASGGGSPLFTVILQDNESNDFDIVPPTTGLGIPEAGDRLPAPRARHISVGSFSLVLADLPDEPAGQNAFIVSQAAEVSYFNFDNTVVVDSRDGKPIIGLRGLYGRTFITKRDSIWQFTLSGISIIDEFQLGLREVNESIGVGGGTSAYDNIIFGAGQKGLHRFDGQNVAYASEELEGDWNTVVDRSDRGLVEMYGVYFWPNSQYWLSVRTRGQNYNERVYVLHTAVGERQGWTRQVLPRHSYMTTRLRPGNQEPELLIGTLSGAILRLADPVENIYTDCADNGVDDLGNLTLQGTIQSGTATSLTVIAGNFDTMGPGLRGCSVKITYPDLTTATRIIESNTNSVLTWREPLSPAPSGAYVIGGYKGYWSSAWVAPQQYGKGLRVDQIDMDLLPNTGQLTIESQVAVQSAAVARAWDESNPTISQVQSMATGWVEGPLHGKEENRGRYFRARFSTDGIQSPFTLVGWGFRWDETGLRGPVPS